MENVAVDKGRQVWKRVLEKDEDEENEWIELSLPPAPEVVDEIYDSHSSQKEKTYACSNIYVNSHPESSWEHLTSVLYKEDEMTAVDQTRPFLPPRGKL